MGIFQKTPESKDLLLYKPKELDNYGFVQRGANDLAEETKKKKEKDYFSSLSTPNKIWHTMWRIWMEGLSAVWGFLGDFFNATKFEWAKVADEEAEANVEKKSNINKIWQYDRDYTKSVTEYKKIEDFYNKSGEDYQKIEAGMVNMPINSQDYYNQEKALKKKGEEVSAIRSRLLQLGGDIGELQKEKEVFESTRGPEVLYFDDEWKGKAFLAGVIAAPTITTTGNPDTDKAKQNDIELVQKRVLASMLKHDYEVYGKTMIKAGSSFENSLGGQTDVYRDYIWSVWDVLNKHYDEIFTDGKMDSEVFERYLTNDEWFKASYSEKEDRNMDLREISDKMYWHWRADKILWHESKNYIWKALSTFWNFWMAWQDLASRRWKEYSTSRKLSDWYKFENPLVYDGWRRTYSSKLYI